MASQSVNLNLRNGSQAISTPRVSTRNLPSSFCIVIISAFAVNRSLFHSLDTFSFIEQPNFRLNHVCFQAEIHVRVPLCGDDTCSLDHGLVRALAVGAVSILLGVRVVFIPLLRVVDEIWIRRKEGRVYQFRGYGGE